MKIRRSIGVYVVRGGLGIALLGAALAGPAFGADAAAGKALFTRQCALCHTAEPGDNGGAQGPELVGVFGRKSASSPGFSYTPAMKKAGLTWDAATLDRFLASPANVVPGSSMVVEVAEHTDRENLIAYFQSVRTASASTPSAPPAASASIEGEADWKKDKPGRVHRIDVANLPAPFATPSARNAPRLVERPADAKLLLPPGFSLAVFATRLIGPRRMIVAANGDVLITETQGGKVSVMRPSADGSKAETVTTFAEGLRQPFGIAFYPDAKNPQWVYVAETHRVVRFPYKTGDQKASAAPEVVVPELPAGGGHFSRDVVFSDDGKRMFVSVGSASNVAEGMSKKSAAEIKAWEAEHGLGAAWDKETNRAAVLVFDVGSNTPGRIFASGIRNCVSLAVQPKTNDLWCTTNERDALGDDLVPDYSTRVKEGGFYGWPWYYMGRYEDPRLKGDRPDLAGKAIVPDVPLQAHSAADNLVFYTATSGKSAFPAEYVGDAFIVLHGSWNRSFRTGHKLVRARIRDGVPTGEYEDFVTGFILDDGNAWARPVAAAVMNDGSLLMSDDGANVVYRISYSANAAQAAAPPAEISIPGERVFPESLTSTSDGTVIIGSLGARTIFRAQPGSATAEAWIQPGTAGLEAVFGVLADNKSNTLYACSGGAGPPPPGSTPPVSALYLFDLKTGASKSHYPFPTAGSSCNDIAVGADGTAYATDTGNMQVVRLKKGAKALEVWAGADGAFGPKGGVLDGIAVLGDRVIVNVLLTSKLFSIPIGQDGAAGKVTELKLTGTLERPDGMRSFGRKSLLVAEDGNGGRLSRVDLDGDHGKVTAVKGGFAGGPVAVTVVGETAYLLEGQLMHLMRPNPNKQPGPFHATAVPVGKP